jgi:hypothetical protein
MPIDHEPGSPFAGELFLTLATEGRLVVDADEADRALAGLQRSLDTVHARLAASRRWYDCADRRVTALCGEGAEDLVDGVFIGQIAPGLLERAAVELPKYIEALRMARRPKEAGRPA